jgi:hypothetical protein
MLDLVALVMVGRVKFKVSSRDAPCHRTYRGEVSWEGRRFRQTVKGRGDSCEKHLARKGRAQCDSGI